MTAWDPIGVGDAPEAWGEYETYAPKVARILRESSDQGRLDNARLASSLVA